ncbi:amino acid adenylation domain-containing protein [Chitinophaga oryziterrae]|uniref:Amino acid adenylation domain-containing protein n=1 Tax=Chitinophaga oryziterrae TaxID=1031224 RepID=A0A6N8JFN8_9BACT|nr:non-ribosomal peptide synthetase [Chitinophaga oryziterrae]MVT43774.1 amino acid adenylation domain-containing protein [Chitinophaga oryziterrae]
MNLLSSLFEAALHSQSGITFLEQDDAGEKLYYRDLYSRALRMLGYLQDQGIREGNELIIQVNNNQHLVCIFWACLLGKIIPVPLSEGTQTEHKRKLFKVCKYLSNPHLICDAKQLERLKIVEEADGYRSVLDNALSIHTAWDFKSPGVKCQVYEEDIAYIQFSSGSTGEPKGVCLTHLNLITNIRDIVSSLRITAMDTLLNWMPLTHDMGIIGFHLVGLCMGINAVCMSTALFIRRPLLWMKQVNYHRATVLYSPNFGLQYFLNALDRKREQIWDLSCIRIIVNGAEPISQRLCNEFSTSLKAYGMADNVILTAYGMAEASVEVSAMQPGTSVVSYITNRHFLNTGDEVQFVDPASPDAVSFVDVGIPVAACEVRICDDKDAPLRSGHIGHIQVRGNNVTKGYYNNEVATKEIFTTDGWLRTGDLGFFIDKHLVVTGRRKNIIIVNGQNYYPQDIERIITDAGITEQGKVVACGDSSVIIFVLYKGNQTDFTDIESKITHVVAADIGIAVQAVVPVTKIPKTTSGKIQHFALLEQYRNKDNNLPYVPQEDNTADTTAKILDAARRLLRNNSLTPATDIFDAGMNSLMIMQLAGEISEATGKHVSVEAVYDHPVFLALGQYLDECTGTQQLPAIRSSGKQVICTLAQERILKECYLNRESAAYNIPVVYNIEGQLDVNAMKTALYKVLSNSEILRTSFGDEHTIKPQVHSLSGMEWDIQVVDLRYTENPEVAAERMTEVIVNTPFVFSAPGQFSFNVIRISEFVSKLVFVIHHVLIDGWSLESLFSDLCRYYNAEIDGREIVPLLSIFQYKDYALWQRDLIENEVLDAQRKYWIQELSQAPPPVDLSVVAGGQITYGHVNAESEYFEWDEHVVQQLKMLSRDYNVSVFGVLLTLLNVLVYRYTNSRDIIIGFDTSGRISKEMEALKGYMLNTLCLRVKLSPEDEFHSLLEHVRGKLLAALDNQLYPFERMLDDNRQGNALFNILVLFQNFYQERDRISLTGCHMERQRMVTKHSFTDLLIEFEETGNRLSVCIVYNKDKFTGRDIAALNEHLKNLSLVAGKEPDKAIGLYSFLTEREKVTLFPSTLHAFGIKRLRLPVHKLFEQLARHVPNAVAVKAGESILSYRELNERANIVANYLRVKINADERVGFMVSRNENMIISMLAILKAGAAYVSIDPLLPVGRCEFIVADSNMKYLLVDQETIVKIDQHFDASFLINLDEDGLRHGNVNNPVFEGLMSNLAYVIYTSGSTGSPKGVMIEHASLTDYVQYFIYRFNITAQDIFLQQASVSFDTIVEEVFPALGVGGSVVIAVKGGADIDDMLSLIKGNNVTLLSTTPLVLNEINTQVDSRISTLRLIISGGDVLHPAHISRLFRNVVIFNSYGPSETTVCATYHSITSLDNASLLGMPVCNSFIYILDENRQVMPAGRVGEIYIEGGLARGYLNHPELTAERFLQHPFKEGQRIYRSGDLGRITENGEIAFCGRADFQFKVRGHRVEPEEIERVISQYEDVKIAGVLLDKENGLLTACMTVRGTFSENALRIFISRQLPYYMIPHRFEILKGIPLTLTGKVDRKALSQQIGKSDNITEHISPHSFTEQKILSIVQRVLKSETIQVNDNFFEQGCNSILALKINGMIRKELGKVLTIQDVFVYPDVRLLSGRIEELPTEKQEEISTVSPASAYSLSPQQQRLFLLSDIYSTSVAYNEGSVYEVNQTLRPDLVKSVLKLLVKKYEILRTTFHHSKEGAVQIVHAADDDRFYFSYTDLSRDEDRLNIANDYIALQAGIKFDLREGPLLRVILIKTDAERSLLSVFMHHIITDDWSGTILINEFFTTYRALEQGIQVPVSAVLQYKDYAQWANNISGKPEIQLHKAYWKRTLSAEIPILNLYTDYTRPAVKKEEAGIVTAVIEKEKYKNIKSLCSRQEVSLFMFLLSGLYALLNRYSGQHDIIIGAAVAGREHPDLRNMPGFFINTLPLRIQGKAGECVTDLLRRSKEVCLDAYTHQSYPFEFIIADVPVRRDSGRSALFDVLINLAPGEVLSSSSPVNIPYRKIKPAIAACKYDLEFYFEELEEEVNVNIVYDSHLFTKERIRQMAAHLNNLLKAMCENPDLHIAQLPYMSTAELNRILIEFNDTVKPFPDADIPSIIRRQLALHGDRTALICDGKSYTYRELNEKASLLAFMLTDTYHVRPDDRVVLLLDRSENIIFSILAVWMCGATYVPVNPATPMLRLAQLLEQSSCSLLLTDERNLDICLALQQEIRVNVFNCSYIPAGLQQTYFSIRPAAAIAYILFTSGSSGKPKGVEVYHHSIINILYGLRERLSVKEADTMLSVSAYTFDISVSEFFLPLISGGTLILATTEQITDVRLLQGLMKTLNPDYMQATPSLWRLLVQSGWSGNKTLTAITCGEPVNRDLLKDLLENTGSLWNLYGPTETTIFSTGCRLMNIDEVITIGGPLENTTVYVLDDYFQPVTTGVTGQLFIGGKGVARGYLSQKEMTDQRFVTGLAVHPGKIFATGDLVRWLPDGRLEYIGRMDDQVKIRGFRVESGEIESRILEFPGVNSAVVLARSMADDDKKLVAFIVSEEIEKTGSNDLRNYLRRYFPDYMVPVSYLSVKEIPLTSSGKTDKQFLLNLPEVEAVPVGRIVKRPETRIEKILIDIWCHAFEKQEICTTDNFFDIGGHSLMANQLVSKIYKDLSVEISISDVFTHATVKEMSALIEKLEQKQYDFVEL